MQHDRLIPDAVSFLEQLTANNTRTWFNSNKQRYLDTLKTPALFLLDDLAARLTRLTGTPTQTKLFRPQRDIRFSKDKTPYKTYLHMLLTSQTGAEDPPQWFFGIAPGQISIGGGRMGFTKPGLARYRAALPELGPALLTELSELQSNGVRLNPPELKRPAAPVTADSALADLARRKSLSVWADLPGPIDNLADRLERDFAQMWPMQQALQAVLQG